MKINRDNFEAYFLDYHEGQLGPEMEAEVMHFVELNPDLQTLFNEFEPIHLVADENIVFEQKSFLKKNQEHASFTVNELNYEEVMIAEIEGLLTTRDIKLLDAFTESNANAIAARKLYAHTRLQNDETIVFEAKNQLKQIAIAVGPITADTYENFFSRETENDLNDEEKKLLGEFLQYNPHLNADRELYKKTILKADSSIRFENKDALKHNVIPVRRLVYYALSAAASLALLFTVYTTLNTNNPVSTQQAVITQPDTQTKPIEQPEKQDVVAIDSKQMLAANTIEKTATNQLITANNSKQSSVTTTEQVLTHRNDIASLAPKAANKIATRSFVDPQFTFIRYSQMHLNHYKELYYNIKLAEQIQYAQLNTKDKNPGKTIYNAASEKAEGLLTLNRRQKNKTEKNNVSLWTFAELGVQTFNTITSSELELNLQKDDEGKVIAYGLEGGLIDVNKEVKK